MNSVFVLQHVNVLRSGAENTKFIGTYRSAENARAAVARLARQPGFCQHPTLLNPLVDDAVAGFYLDEYTLDQDHWCEGYVTLLPSGEPYEP